MIPAIDRVLGVLPFPCPGIGWDFVSFLYQQRQSEPRGTLSVDDVVDHTHRTLQGFRACTQPAPCVYTASQFGARFCNSHLEGVVSERLGVVNGK